MRCSTNFMSYPSFSHPPSSPSLFVPRVNSNSPILANSALGARYASDLFSFFSSMWAAFGITSSRALRRASRSYWTSLGWVRLPPRCLVHSLTHSSVGHHSVHTTTHAAPPARSPHHRTVSRRHDRGVRDRIRARGDQSRHPRDARPDPDTLLSCAAHVRRSTRPRRRRGARSARLAAAPPRVPATPTPAGRRPAAEWRDDRRGPPCAAAGAAVVQGAAADGPARSGQRWRRRGANAGRGDSGAGAAGTGWDGPTRGQLDKVFMMHSLCYRM